MGMFSWKTSDTDESVWNSSFTDPTPAVMIDNKGNQWVELDYEGYGVFGGKDFFELVSEMNGKGTDRFVGIDLVYGKEDCLSPKIVSIDFNGDYDSIPDSDDCPYQGIYDFMEASDN